MVACVYYIYKGYDGVVNTGAIWHITWNANEKT